MAIKEVIYTAVLIESERGWGQRVDEVREFKTEKKRDDFIKEFNSHNNKPTVPDWYMYAEKGKDILREPKRKKTKKH
jgi:hypothetical protein